MANANCRQRRQGNLDERCNDALIWELMLQSGPICESQSDARRCDEADCVILEIVTILVNVGFAPSSSSMAHCDSSTLLGILRFSSSLPCALACFLNLRPRTLIRSSIFACIYSTLSLLCTPTPSLDLWPLLLVRSSICAHTHSLARPPASLACSPSLMQPTCTYRKTECQCLTKDSDSANSFPRRTQNTRVE